MRVHREIQQNCVAFELTEWTDVCDGQGNSHKLGVPVLVPHQKLCLRRNPGVRSVIDFFIVLEGEQVLFTFVPSAADKTHPAGTVFITSVDVVQQFPVVVNLKIRSTGMIGRTWIRHVLKH